MQSKRLATVVQGLVVADDFAHDKGEEFFGKIGIKFCGFGKRPKPCDLLELARGIGGRQALRRLELAYRLGELEALGQQMHQRRVDIVDGIAQPLQLGMRVFGHVAVSKLANGGGIVGDPSGGAKGGI